MFTYYRSQVLLAYLEKKDADALSLNLTYPTPSKLKQECMIVLNERYRAKDEKILRSFLGLQEDANAYLQAFKKLDADKLRPLDNYLKQKTDDTDEKNVELLAWLIDFKPRPYQIGWETDDQLTEVNNTNAGIRNKLKQIKKNVQNGFNSINKHIQTLPKQLVQVFIILFIITCLGITYFIWARFHRNEGCMYWAGNDYQQVSCSKKMRDTLVFALDTFRLSHFKRLNNPDTITERAVGHVWYIKSHNKLEFFTSNGEYPADPTRNVKPLSVYMIDKYILNKSPTPVSNSK